MYIKFNQDISDTYTNFIDEMTNITTQAASVHQQFYNELQSIYPQIWANLIKSSENITERKHFNQLREHSQLKKLTEFADSLTHTLDLIYVPEDKMNYLYRIGPEEFPRIIENDLIDSQEIFEYTVAREQGCQALRKHNSTMNSLFTYSVGLFEKLISDIVTQAFRNDKTARDNYNRMFIRFSKKMDGESGNKYSEMLLNMDRKNSRTIHAYNEYVSKEGFWNLIDLMFDSDKRLRNNPLYKLLMPFYRELKERRNLLMHRGNYADEKYYNSIKNTKTGKNTDYTETLSQLFKVSGFWPNLDPYIRSLIYPDGMPHYAQISNLEDVNNPLDDLNEEGISPNAIDSHPLVNLNVNAEYITVAISTLTTLAGFIFVTAFQTRSQKYTPYKWHITGSMNKIYQYMFDELRNDTSPLLRRTIMKSWWQYWIVVSGFCLDKETGPLAKKRLPPDFDAWILILFSLIRLSEYKFFRTYMNAVSEGHWSGGIDGLVDSRFESVMEELPYEWVALVTAAIYSSSDLLEVCKQLKDPIPDDFWPGLTFGMLYTSPIFSYHLEDPDIVSFFQELSQSNQGATSKHGK